LVPGTKAKLIDREFSSGASCWSCVMPVGSDSSPSAWMATWSAPASRCSRSFATTVSGSPCATRASIRRSEPPFAMSSSVKPIQIRFFL
jgi:hypothetical protein